MSLTRFSVLAAAAFAIAAACTSGVARIVCVTCAGIAWLVILARAFVYAAARER